MTVYLTAKEAARQLRISPRVLREKAAANQIRASKPGRAWLFEQADLDDYVTAGQNRPPAAVVRRRRRRAA